MDAAPPASPQRLDRPDFDLLGRALVISLALHVLCFGGYKLEKRYGFLERIHLPHWLQQMQHVLALVRPPPRIPPPEPQEPPLIFVEVNPAFAVPEPPKNARYYSSRSSRAANPNADTDSNVPKISGQQTDVTKTESAPRNPPPKPRPQAQPPAPEQTEPEAKPKAAQTPGDLAFAKPQPKTRQGEGEAEEEHPRPRPRTLAEAAARQALMPGEKMRQIGGVRPHAVETTLDAKATPFGEYDAAVIAAIQNRWDQLLENQPLTRATGKVVLAFHLNYDGTITDMTVLDTTVSILLTAMCQRAVLDPAPYGVWPSDMRRLNGANFRDVTFTFYYR